MGSRLRWTRIAGALVLSAATANAALAQTYEGPEQDPQALEAEAEGYMTDMNKWTRAADLYRQAAALRGAGDVIAIADLKTAARLEFYRGHEGTAMRDLENAGERALAMGDVVAAANAFVDAAWIASAEGRGTKAREFADKAQLLALSPLISPSDREELEARLVTTSP